MREQLEHAYAVGDHRTLRAIARGVLARAPGQAGHDSELEARARELLAYTAPDPFLAIVGALGLGLMALLVYNCVP